MFEELLCKYTHSLVRALRRKKKPQNDLFLFLLKKRKNPEGSTPSPEWIQLEFYKGIHRTASSPSSFWIQWREKRDQKLYWSKRRMRFRAINSGISDKHYEQFYTLFFFFNRSYLCSGLIRGRTLNSRYNTDLNQSKSEEYITGWICTEHILVATTNDAQCSSLIACLAKHFPNCTKNVFVKTFLPWNLSWTEVLLHRQQYLYSYKEKTNHGNNNTTSKSKA